ncbi:carbohydrate porin [Ancylobacter sp. Lp-2]|uniref:carbohydrate porin n=1 Tax=Ancylobacter sp. Lp-2 TaxID=2881339 RepID=UPI001E3B43FF|nr:carbohydrate porin [Ancylobacter sp. Lp-2]MCB4769633.1 carbohydrate porin [Ancylobacter sp. Lp-2]
MVFPAQRRSWAHLPGCRLGRGMADFSAKAMVSIACILTCSTTGLAADEPDGSGWNDILTRSTLTGDWGGARTALENKGVTITLTQTSDFLANPSGGIRQGSAYDGLFQPEIDIDLEKLIGWKGGNVHVAAYGVQGHGLSQYDIGNLLTVTSVEAPNGWYLGELWFQQSLLSDALAIKVGRILADQNFVISETAGVFVNSTFGFPGSFAVDLPGGGPAYPNAVPGAQLIVKPDSAWTIQTAIFEGSPDGSTFSADGVLAIAELAHAFTPGKNDHRLAGTYKIGAWYNSERFDDLAIASNGASLASPLSSGTPRNETGNYAFYVVVDQSLWSEPGAAGQGLSGFARATFTPLSDRNQINWYVDAGLAYTGLFPGRDSDIFGVGFAYAHMSGGASDLARATNAYSGVVGPVPDYEAVLEITYQAAVTPWLSVQPFFQYVFHPGGNAPDPDDPSAAIRDASVIGLRMAVTL